jgi:hypothetical protein
MANNSSPVRRSLPEPLAEGPPDLLLLRFLELALGLRDALADEDFLGLLWFLRGRFA